MTTMFEKCQCIEQNIKYEEYSWKEYGKAYKMICNKCLLFKGWIKFELLSEELMKVGKIEKNIDIWPVRTREKYPFKHMKIGDSFFVSFEEDDDIKRVYHSVKGSAYYWKSKGYQIEVRMDKKNNGVRVWRV